MTLSLPARFSNRYRRSIRDYTKSLKLYPTDAWALHNRGLAWRGLGKMEKAEEDLGARGRSSPCAGVVIWNHSAVPTSTLHADSEHWHKMSSPTVQYVPPTSFLRFVRHLCWTWRDQNQSICHHSIYNFRWLTACPKV